MRLCFVANVSGTPSSLHCARSVPSGFTVVGTRTRASRAKSSRNSSPGSPIILYDAPETWAEVIGTSRSASESRATVRRSRIDVRWAGQPAEFLESALVHEHDVRDRDDLAKPPPQLPDVPGPERLVPRRVVRPAALHHALVASRRGGVDREDRQVIPERLAEHIEFGTAPEAVD